MNGERTPEHLAQANDPRWRGVAGMLRRMLVRFTTKGIWQLDGYSRLREVTLAEVFQGVGFWARPPAGVQVEAVVLQIGGSDHPVVVALRDEATRKAVADALLADEAVQYNSLARVHVQADGTIEARSHGGTALALATKADLQALRDWIHTTMVVITPSGNSTAGTTTPPPSPAGTTVLKGE